MSLILQQSIAMEVERYLDHIKFATVVGLINSQVCMDHIFSIAWGSSTSSSAGTVLELVALAVYSTQIDR